MFLTEEIKEIIVSNILKISNPKKIILFGSYARGDANENSDVDIILIKEKIKSRINEIHEVREYLEEIIDMSVDVLVVEEDNYNFYINECGSVYRYASQEGEVLYGKKKAV